MKLARILLFFFLWTISGSAALAETTIYRFDKLIDGDGEILAGQDIAVKDGRIVAVGTGLDQNLNGQLISMGGLTALPGLIDAHTHITYGLPESPKGAAWAELGATTREQRFEASKRNALLTLATGVTSIRDLNADQDLDFDLRDAINRGDIIGPRVFASGPGIHPFNDPLPEGIEEASASFLRVAAQKRIDAGADWIKIFGTTGSADDLTSRAYYSAAAIRAAAEVAQAAGKRITVHSYGPQAVNGAITAGVTSLDHPVGMSRQQLVAMQEKDIIYVPTVDHNRYYAHHGEEYGYGEDVQASLHVFVGRNIESVRRAHANGVTIAMGSDAVMTGFGQNTCELRAFIAAGLTPAESIQTATVNGAKLLGKETELGRLAEGFIADIVAVAGDPLTDIDALVSNVIVVIKEGQIVVDHRNARAAINKPDCGTLY